MKKEIIHGPRGSASLEEIACGIYRLLIPFEDLTTTVYIEKRDTGVGIAVFLINRRCGKSCCRR